MSSPSRRMTRRPSEIEAETTTARITATAKSRGIPYASRRVRGGVLRGWIRRRARSTLDRWKFVPGGPDVPLTVSSWLYCPHRSHVPFADASVGGHWELGGSVAGSDGTPRESQSIRTLMIASVTESKAGLRDVRRIDERQEHGDAKTKPGPVSRGPRYPPGPHRCWQAREYRAIDWDV